MTPCVSSGHFETEGDDLSSQLLAPLHDTPSRRDAAEHDTIKVALLGCGNVGSPVARVLIEEPDRIQRATGTRVELRRVAVANPLKPRAVSLPRGLITDDALSAVCDLDIHIVIEAIGGIDPSLRLIQAAIADGKSVVTANKEVMALYGVELRAAALRKGVHLLYEAAVGAAIPIIRSVQESLATTPLKRIRAILNGTTNFVLTEMERTGASLEEALGKAQARGYAEANPSNDIDGSDALVKALILATIASDATPIVEKRQGIDHVTPELLVRTLAEGFRNKLVAEIDLTLQPTRVRVSLETLPHSDRLATVDGVDNAAVIETRDGTSLFFQGPGAGGEATAIAILGDLATAVKDRAQLRLGPKLACA